jgi:hypothetical protein
MEKKIKEKQLSWSSVYFRPRSVASSSHSSMPSILQDDGRAGASIDGRRWCATEFFYIFFNYFENYRTVWNFSGFGNQPPCVTAICNATAITHSGKGAANGPLRGAGPVAAYRRGLRPPWPTAVGCYHRGRRRQPCLYKGRRLAAPPTLAAAPLSTHGRPPR